MASLTEQQVKKMNLIEQGHLAQKMYDQGFNQKFIAEKLFVTIPQVSNLRLLASLPLNMKKRIINKEVSATLLLKVIRANRDITQDDAVEMIERIAAQNSGKITNKNVNKEKQVHNSLVIFKKIEKQTNINKVTKNQDVYELLRGILDGKLNRASFLEYFGIK